MLLWKTAKKFDELNPESVRAYHKYHIEKMMGIALLGMDSEYSLDNGDISVKIVFQRSQIDKVIQRNIVGKFIIIIKNKQDIQCVHCCIIWSFKW